MIYLNQFYFQLQAQIMEKVLAKAEIMPINQACLKFQTKTQRNSTRSFVYKQPKKIVTS